MPKNTHTTINTDILEGDAVKTELKRLQEKLEHQRNLARLRGARYYANHGKVLDPVDRKKPGRKPKPKFEENNNILETHY